MSNALDLTKYACTVNVENGTIDTATASMWELLRFLEANLVSKLGTRRGVETYIPIQCSTYTLQELQQAAQWVNSLVIDAQQDAAAAAAASTAAAETAAATAAAAVCAVEMHCTTQAAQLHVELCNTLHARRDAELERVMLAAAQRAQQIAVNAAHAETMELESTEPKAVWVQVLTAAAEAVEETRLHVAAAECSAQLHFGTQPKYPQNAQLRETVRQLEQLAEKGPRA